MPLDLWKFDFEESKQLAKNPLLIGEPCFKFVKNIKIALIGYNLKKKNIRDRRYRLIGFKNVTNYISSCKSKAASDL